MKKNLLLVGLAAGLGAPAARAQAPALATFPVGTATVTVSELTPGLATIWELAWGPDDFLWATERAGRISRINPTTGAVLPLLTIDDVTQNNESGLLGMALHPDFATQPYVYVVYNYTEQGALKEKLVRYTYAAAAGTLGAPLVLLGGIGATTTHSGSRLLILPDRTLLMTTGDAQQQPEAQNKASLNGKILRLNLDGTVPADNPTPGSYVYTLGHRNPQGLVQLADGRLYSSEHGPNNDDEINKIEVGRNYGWPTVEGLCNLPAEAAFCAANNVREPLTTWTPTIAPAALKYYDHPAIPGWRGSLLAAALGGRRLVQMPLDASGMTITARNEFLATFGRLRSLCVSPAGRVYVGTSNRDGRGTPATADDRILVLENRAYMPTANRNAAAVKFEIFPNPARQQASLTLPAPGAHVTICDMLGRRLREQSVAGLTATLDLVGLPAGRYLVAVATAAGTATRPLSVE
ncbi:PQQ-dependent sugar dehydrogenase [Hymenobacter nivis]|uniref:T9SS C-terminal target domain-containing protein n=1 Tax=Hymenobacter nivis TaxID=1850093 RepID=A0A502GTL8_9BACT|nr:PQQ-dependent sugar dehydrogenase [Hymenobacter nivis]TPG64600.1 T9SS C-terminal target domain-containing protein [Hymenobacter nivis]